MATSAGSYDALARFVNALPTSGEIIPWLNAFRDALRALLGDVDHLTININYLCDIREPHRYQPNKGVTQHIPADSGEEVSIALQHDRFSSGDRILQTVRQNGFPTEEFEAPVLFDYFLAEKAYLGTIILWRKREHGAVPAGVIAMMESFHQFFLFLLSDVVARHNVSRPIDGAFHYVLETIAEELKLTNREQEVLAAHLFGYPYQKIADQLYMSIDTVRKHVKAIHRKAKVGTYTELFAKYFTPRVFLHDGESEE